MYPFIKYFIILFSLSKFELSCLLMLQDILHFDSEQFFNTEYRRIIHYFLVEEAKSLRSDQIIHNPYQDIQEILKTELYGLNAHNHSRLSSGRGTILSSFLNHCLSIIHSSACWYSESSNGWITSEGTVVFSFESVLLLINKYFAIAFTQSTSSLVSDTIW